MNNLDTNLNIHDIVLLAHEHLTACQLAITKAENREQLTESTRIAFQAEHILMSLRIMIKNSHD